MDEGSRTAAVSARVPVIRHRRAAMAAAVAAVPELKPDRRTGGLCVVLAVHLDALPGISIFSEFQKGVYYGHGDRTAAFSAHNGY